MKAPRFWNAGKRSLRATMLSPIGGLYKAATSKRANKKPKFKAPIPVFCVGNLIMGGAGKTPTAIALAKLLKAQGKNPYFLSRGYKGSIDGPEIIKKQSAKQVGDEPKLLGKIAPVCISKDRVAGAKACLKAGADCIIMDDGYQNPNLFKDFSFIVIDGGYGHGNEKTFPAGPMRESLHNGLKRCHAVILIGEDQTGVLAKIKQEKPDLPIFRTDIHLENPDDFKDQKVIAFAGIARPEKFYQSLEQAGAELLDKVSFPDHYAFSKKDLLSLEEKAESLQAKLVTTEKDWVRLPVKMQKKVAVLKISLAWQGEDVLKAIPSTLLE